MQTSDQGLELLIAREGKRNTAYRDSVGVWTIGVGHTGPEVHAGLVWTDEQVEDAFRKDIERFANTVNDSCTVDLEQNQFDALVSFCFNVGQSAFSHSTMVKMINVQNWAEAAHQFDRWHIPPEITGRRNGEREQFRGTAFEPTIPS